MQMENSLKELQSDLDKAKDDVEFWKKKAEKIPTIQMLESELQNIKVCLFFSLIYYSYENQCA